MPSGAIRRLGLLDLLVLIAATAVGLGLLRVCLRGFGDRPPARRPGAYYQSTIATGLTCAAAILAPWSFAVLALSLRGPRASLRRLARRPGFLACAAATAGVAASLVVSAVQVARGRMALDAANVSRIASVFDFHAGLMTAGAWLSLALGGRWRAETSWVGRAGRALGVAWIGLLLLGWLRVLF